MTALLQVLRPKGRRRGPRRFIRVSRARKANDPLTYDPWDFL